MGESVKDPASVKDPGSVKASVKVPDPATDQAVEVDAKDLPAFCPHPAMTLWSQHPRVYLELSVTGQARCPYCGTLYRIKPGTQIPGH